MTSTNIVLHPDGNRDREGRSWRQIWAVLAPIVAPGDALVSPRERVTRIGGRYRVGLAPDEWRIAALAWTLIFSPSLVILTLLDHQAIARWLATGVASGFDIGLPVAGVLLLSAPLAALVARLHPVDIVWVSTGCVFIERRVGPFVRCTILSFHTIYSIAWAANQIVIGHDHTTTRIGRRLPQADAALLLDYLLGFRSKKL